MKKKSVISFVVTAAVIICAVFFAGATGGLSADASTVASGKYTDGQSVKSLTSTESAAATLYEVRDENSAVVNNAKDNINRIAGTGRIDTAIEISKEGWTKSGNAIIAYGMNYADALAAVPLASALECPILLTENLSSGLEAKVQAELLRLDVGKIYLVGGEYVVSTKTENYLKSVFGSSNVIRVAGQSRYGTSIAIAKKLLEIRKQKGLGNFTNAYFCSAGGFADALAISPVAGIELNPVLYAPAKGSSLSQASPEMYSYVKSLKSSGLRDTTIIGGVYAVSVEAANELRALMGKASERVDAGMTGGRYDTMLNVCKRYYSYFSESGTICAATGKNFPDALAGAVLAAKKHSPIILTGYDVYSAQSENVRAFIGSKSVGTGYIFGGVNAVPEWQYNILFDDPKPSDELVTELLSTIIEGYAYYVPYVNFDTADARKVNDYIRSNYYETAQIDMQRQIMGYDCGTDYGYSYALNGNILSLFIHKSGYGSYCDAFNFDVGSGCLVSKSVVLTQMGYSEQAFITKATRSKNTLLEGFLFLASNDYGVNAKKTLERFPSEYNVFINEFGKLVFIARVYWTDGGYADFVINIDSGYLYYGEWA